MYKPDPQSEFRVKFDFRVDFTNGGYVEGHDFLLDLEGDTVSEEELKLMIVEAMNLLNRVNFLRVNDVVCGTTAQPGFISGCDPKFLTGPFDFRGIRGLPPTAPLGFVGAAPPRQFQFGLKFGF